MSEEKTLIKDPDLVLSKKALWAWKSGGFTSGIIEGPRGIGKSTYALKVMYDIFKCMGYLDDVAWQMALDRMLYRISDIIDFLDKSTRKRTPECIFCWDDAAVFGSSMVWYTDVKLVHLLQSTLDTIRGSVSAMLLTCPNQGQLLKFLRNYDGYIIRINYAEEGGYYRDAKGYIWRSLPSGTRRIYPNYSDHYSCRLPNDVFAKYKRKRKSYNVENINALKEAMKKNKETDPQVIMPEEVEDKEDIIEFNEETGGETE